MKDYTSSSRRDLSVLELEIAMEILAEVFAINVSEIDEMLKLRYQDSTDRHASHLRNKQARPLLKHPRSETDDWPAEFCLAE